MLNLKEELPMGEIIRKTMTSAPKQESSRRGSPNQALSYRRKEGSKNQARYSLSKLVNILISEGGNIPECTSEFILKQECIHDEKALSGRHRYRQKLKDDIVDFVDKWTWEVSQRKVKAINVT